MAEGTPWGLRLVVLVKSVVGEGAKDKDGRSARKPLITRNAIFLSFRVGGAVQLGRKWSFEMRLRFN